jgi:hypothetical protein
MGSAEYVEKESTVDTGSGDHYADRAQVQLQLGQHLLGGTVLALVLSLISCGGEPTEPPEGFGVAWMITSCSPVDGPAIELYLGEAVPSDVSQPTYPHVRVAIETSENELSGATFSSGDVPSRIFVAQHCTAIDQCTPASSVVVEFSHHDGAAAEYDGYLKMTLPNGASVEGTFRAALHHRLILCG